MRIHIQALLVAAIASGCGIDDEATIDSIELADSVYQWEDEVVVPYRLTSHQVGLAELGSHLYMSYKDNDSTAIKVARFDGTSWAGLANTSQTSKYGPALTVFRGLLTSVYHQADETRLMMSQSTTGTFWSTPVTAGTSLGTSWVHNAPAVTVSNDRLYVGYCKGKTSGGLISYSVHLDRYDGATWTSIADWPVGGTCKGIAMTRFPDGQFVVVYNRELNGNWAMFEIRGVGTPSSSWPITSLPMTSRKPPSLVVCNGRRHLVHGDGGGDGEPIWWSVFEDDAWQDDVRVPNQVSSGGATLGCLGTREFLIHNDSGTQIYSSEWGP